MRTDVRTLALVLLLAGCGQSTSLEPDAGAMPDARPSADAGLDAPRISPDAAIAPDAANTPDAAPMGDAGPLVTGVSPPLPSQGGPVLATPFFATLTYQGDGNRDAVDAFGALMATDPWWAPSVSEYGVGALTSLGNVHLPDAAPASATQADLESYLLAQAAAGALPTNPSGTREGVVYLLYLPASANVTLSDGAMSCSGWHGVHGEAGTGAARLVYALAIDCGPGRGFDALGYMEAAASHELLEAVTDPFVNTTPAYQMGGPPSPWSIFGELTDRCVGRYLVRGTSVLARNWSNAAGAAGMDPCVPAPPGEVYYGVATPSTSVHGAAGTTITVPLTGFARGVVADFPITVQAAAGPNTAPRLSRTTLNEGLTATLTLRLPAGTRPGTNAWVLLTIGPAANDSRNYPLMVTFD